MVLIRQPRSWWRAIACSLASADIVFGLTGCSFWPTSCGNRGVRAAIENDARESTSLWQTTTKEVVDLSKTSFVLTDTVMTGESGNIRSCTGTMKVSQADNSVGVPIEYEVVRTDDGEVKYRWDKGEFGKKLIATTLLEVLVKAAQPTSKDDRPTGNQSESNEPSGVTAPAAQNLSEPDWRQAVSRAIRSKAEAQPHLPHGTQTIRFRVEVDGAITDVQSIGQTEDRDLAEAAIRIVRSVGRVPPPPSHRSQRLTQKMTF